LKEGEKEKIHSEKRLQEITEGEGLSKGSCWHDESSAGSLAELGGFAVLIRCIQVLPQLKTHRIEQ
jgi:hypothetical protein